MPQGVGGSLLFVVQLGLLLPDGRWDSDNGGTLPGQPVGFRSEFGWDSSGPLREREWRSISIAGSSCSSKCYRTVGRAHRQYQEISHQFSRSYNSHFPSQKTYHYHLREWDPFLVTSFRGRSSEEAETPSSRETTRWKGRRNSKAGS